MNGGLKKYRELTCPRCGSCVRIPWFWTLGIEGIFRCRTCRLPFKTGYKTGAVLSALGLSFAVVTVQWIVYLFGAYSILPAVLLLPLLWVAYAFPMRKRYMLWKTARRLKRRPESSGQDPRV